PCGGVVARVVLGCLQKLLLTMAARRRHLTMTGRLGANTLAIPALGTGGMIRALTEVALVTDDRRGEIHASPPLAFRSEADLLEAKGMLVLGSSSGPTPGGAAAG